MNYKVCILAAGKGTRNKYAQASNKALLPLGDSTILSYIMSKFPTGTEFVIAVGYNANKIMSGGEGISYVLAEYEGLGVGPGRSLLCCEPYLQCPFIYMACDTIVTDNIPSPDKNWMGVSLVREKLPYLTVSLKHGLIKQVYDKGDKDARFTASIGLVGVHDYKVFWDGLKHPAKLIQNEHQDTSGLNALIPYKLHAVNFTWFDTGTTEGYERTAKLFNTALPKRAD